ncbi:hypothetical protein FO519_002691 [Halicephalobus sp. NKZ332]|nr:hypothetical protein FO519_002691 [Halicephalobus sp. NKZ332]
MASLKLIGFALTFVALALISNVSAKPEDEVSNIWEEIKNIRISELRKSALACPLPVVGSACPEDTPLYYFKCCGELNSNCCFRLQDWVIVVLGVMTILVILSIIVNLIRCLCCY